jgi:tryptophanyl-tRNA synthetase
VSRDPFPARFDGKGYGDLKRAVADAVIAVVEPLRGRYAELMVDPGFLEQVLAEGAERVRPIARLTLGRVKKLMGLSRA